MIAKFVPVCDTDRNVVYPQGCEGIKDRHKEWRDLYEDQRVGDSLANTMRHWDKEVPVNSAFLIIGGRESITSVLDCYLKISVRSHKALVNRQGNRTGKSYTTVLLIPEDTCKSFEAKTVNNIGDVRAQINLSRLDRTALGETLEQFRRHWKWYVHVTNFVNSF